MTPGKYERLRGVIDDLLPAREWIREKMLAAPEETISLGVQFKTPETIFVGKHAEIGAGTVIHGDVSIRGESVIGQNCVIEHAHLTNTHLGPHVFIGPFAQISESDIGEGTDIPHHSYIGNALIGKYCNIGDSVTISNFDGILKHLTIIEDGCFIGTKTRIVSPVRIGRESFVAVQELSRDIPPHSFVTQTIDMQTGFHAEIIKPNRSFQLMPGKWLWTKKPIAPELMYELREKIADMYPDTQDWWRLYTARLPIFQGETTWEAMKSDGEKAVREFITLLRQTEHGSCF